jgi:hypothetical protein
MKRKNLTLGFILAGLFFSVGFFSQDFTKPSKLNQFNVTVNFDDYTVKTQMLSHNKKFSPDNDRVYMWYAAQKIMETKGGFDGKLIHGTYRAFYLNDQLKEQGNISYGLKNKEWKYWYSDGKLKEVINWKDGVKSGRYFLYNDYGQLMAKGRFKNDKLHGWFYTYNNIGKLADKKKYKCGDEVVRKQRTKRENKKWNLFKKKAGDADSTSTEEKIKKKTMKQKRSDGNRDSRRGSKKEEAQNKKSSSKKKKSTSTVSPSEGKKEIQS